MAWHQRPRLNAPRRSVELVGFMDSRFSQGKGMLSVLFRSVLPEPPFVKSVDILEECIVVYNPSNITANMAKWILTDKNRQHVFHFPDNYKLEPGQEVVIYCTPGNPRDQDLFAENYLLWTDSDGSLRRRHVLGTDLDMLYLYDSQGVEITSARIPESGIVQAQKPSKWRKIDYLIRQSNLALCYLRIGLLLLAGVYVKQYPLRTMILYTTAFIVDVIARDICAWVGPDIMYNVMCTLSDRISSVILLANLANQYDESSIFLGLLILDLSSHWIYGHVTFGPVSGHQSGKMPEDIIDILKLKTPMLLMMVCLGSELFFLYHFARATGVLAPSNPISIVQGGYLFVGYVVITGCCVAKQILLLVQLLSALSLSSAAVLSVRAVEQMYN